LIKASTLSYSKVSRLDREELVAAVEKAEESWAKLTSQVKDLVIMAKDQERRAREGTRYTAVELEEKRSALQQARQRAFEEVVGFGEAPPAYHNCCPRHEMYEQQCNEEVEQEMREDEQNQDSA
jgi:hypothetical protein